MVSWFFLGIGIGLGSLWAYVVLGWGGYWGWDAVENASLFPWLIGVALIHSFTVYRRRGAFKRWSIMCACLTFAFVITGTFISRSGLVQSVHAFEGDPVSLALFGSLIVLSILAGIVGLIVRRKSFKPDNPVDENVDNFMSRDAAYYFNNVIMVVFTFVICYLTVASALPSWLPFGGQSLSAGTYNAVARPLGVLYCLVLAVCPLLGWTRTDKASFLKKAKIPAICAAVLFVALMVLTVTVLWPNYDAQIAGGGSNGTGLANEGPEFYYKGLGVVGFAVASLIFFNTLFLIGRNCSAWAKGHDTNAFAAFFKMMNGHASTYGGYLAHIGIAVILVGLIGSSMFVYEKAGYVSVDSSTNSAQDFVVRDFTLKYTGSSIVQDDAQANIYYVAEYDVYRNGSYVGHVAPSLQMVSATQQTKSNAAVISLPEEDLFVVYKGVNSAGAYSMDVRINPLINFVWAGFFILIAGAAFAGMGRRAAKKEEVEAAQHEIDVEEAELAEERALAAAEAKAAKAEASAEKRAGKVSDVKNDK
jgi:cytochrome c-type biogenesis protein CcmF